MELPKFNFSDNDMLGGLKSKLGFGKKDDYGDYGDYDDYDFEDAYADDYDDYADEYGSYDDYANGYSAPIAESNDTSSQGAFSSRAGVTLPRLVSIDDVRASTQLEIDAGASREAARAQASYAPAEPVPASEVGLTANLPEWRPRSEGLDSLFAPTTGAAGAQAQPEPSGFSGVQAAAAPYGAAQPTVRSAAAYEPVPSYAGTVSRNMSIIKPVSYNDVERLARFVRNGDVVVLAMRNTQESLFKRILDFSFGVASALDARVDCVGDKIYAIACGEALSPRELQDLKSRGVL